MLVDIIPSDLSGSIQGITSKSYLHRALIISALGSSSPKVIYNTLSEDIIATISCIKSLGGDVEITDDYLVVTPIKNTKTGITLDCNESGSTARFILPVASCLTNEFNITGSGNLPNRPLSDLKNAISHKVSFDDYLPCKVTGKLTSGDYDISGSVSSQFITGLLLSAASTKKPFSVNILPPVNSKGYIDITTEVLSDFGISFTKENNKYTLKDDKIISPEIYNTQCDWSNAAFYLVAGVLGNEISVTGLEPNSSQGDRAIFDVIKSFGGDISFRKNICTAKKSSLKSVDIDGEQIPDLIPVIAVMASVSAGSCRLYNLSRLRIKESDRIKTTCDMLSRLGADIKISGDELHITGKESLIGGTVDSFGDHRIAMAAAIASIKCKKTVRILNSQAVNKSYPHFFEDFKSVGGSIKEEKENGK